MIMENANNPEDRKDPNIEKEGVLREKSVIK